MVEEMIEVEVVEGGEKGKGEKEDGVGIGREIG